MCCAVNFAFILLVFFIFFGGMITCTWTIDWIVIGRLWDWEWISTLFHFARFGSVQFGKSICFFLHFFLLWYLYNPKYTVNFVSELLLENNFHFYFFAMWFRLCVLFSISVEVNIVLDRICNRSVCVSHSYINFYTQQINHGAHLSERSNLDFSKYNGKKKSKSHHISNNNCTIQNTI